MIRCRPNPLASPEMQIPSILFEIHSHRRESYGQTRPPSHRLSLRATPPRASPPPQSSDSNFPKGMPLSRPERPGPPAVRRSFDPVSGAFKFAAYGSTAVNFLSLGASRSLRDELVSELNPKLPLGSQV